MDKDGTKMEISLKDYEEIMSLIDKQQNSINNLQSRHDVVLIDYIDHTAMKIPPVIDRDNKEVNVPHVIRGSEIVEAFLNENFNKTVERLKEVNRGLVKSNRDKLKEIEDLKTKLKMAEGEEITMPTPAKKKRWRLWG